MFSITLSETVKTRFQMVLSTPNTPEVSLDIVATIVDFFFKLLFHDFSNIFWIRFSKIWEIGDKN